MLNNDRDFRSKQDTEYQAYKNALVSLSDELDKLSGEIQEHYNNLSRKYPQEALIDLAKYFEGISARFLDYLTLDGMIKEILNRSKDNRLKTAIQIEQVAMQTAILFEEYSFNPENYSQVKSRLQIRELLNEIRNLKAYCK